MILDTDQDILITTRYDTVQEAELVKAAKYLQLCYDAFWNDHFYGEQACLYFSLTSIRSPKRNDQPYYKETFNLFSYTYQKGSQYDLRDPDKALGLIHDRLKKILEIVERNYSKDHYLKFMDSQFGNEKEY